MKRIGIVLVFVFALSIHIRANGQDQTQNTAIELQKQKLQALSMMDGVWRGSMWTMTPTGSRMELTQTERVGPMLGGTLKVVEGRGYNTDDELVFNALGVISWDVLGNKYLMHSYAQGRQGDYELEVTNSGFKWKINFGPGVVQYTATISDGHWHEIGERIVEGREPVTFLEMNLERVSDTDWPAGNAVPPR